jgi:hypothetical protein
VLARIAAHALILGVNPRCSSILVGVIVVWGVLTETSSVQASDVANPHASAAARRVLDFFQRLGGEFGRTRDDALEFVRELGVRLGEASFEFGKQTHNF